MMVKVYAHVATFGSLLALSCGAAYTVTYLYQKPEDVKLQELDSKYKDQIKFNDERRKQMESFFQNMKESNEHPERESGKFSGGVLVFVVASRFPFLLSMASDLLRKGKDERPKSTAPVQKADDN